MRIKSLCEMIDQGICESAGCWFLSKNELFLECLDQSACFGIKINSLNANLKA